MPQFPMLSDSEAALLNALTTYNTVKNASHYLRYDEGFEDMTEKKCYDTLGRLRVRYKKARAYVNLILSYRQRSPTLAKVLTPKIPMKEDDLDEKLDDLS